MLYSISNSVLSPEKLISMQSPFGLDDLYENAPFLALFDFLSQFNGEGRLTFSVSSWSFGDIFRTLLVFFNNFMNTTVVVY